MKPEIYCKKCANFEECKYVSDLKKESKRPEEVSPVLYGPCSNYIPKRKK